MKLVFCGTPQFALPCLERLVQSPFDVELVLCQPDRPQGRGMQLAEPPIKQAARKLGLPVIQPEKIRNNEELRTQLTQINPDAIVVVAYGRIIPKWMLDLPRFGNINVHASLLPKYRGAAPIQWAIANGEAVTGVTTMRIDEGLDTGDMLLKRGLEIQADDTAVTLASRLSELGADLLVETLHDLERGVLKPVPQEDVLATQAPILKKEDGKIEFHRTAQEIYNRLRGFQPWPGAYTQFRGKNLKIIAAQPIVSSHPIPAGEIQTSGEKLLVGCGQNSALELIQLQPEGKKPMPARDFVSGYRPAPGERLG